MAKLVYEKRSFKDRAGMSIDYEVYEIQAVVQGELMTLPLQKTLNPAEKIAFKILASEQQQDSVEVYSRGATEEEQDEFLKKNQESDSDDDKLDLFD